MHMSDPELPVTVTYGCPRWVPDWAVPEVPVPESDTHDLCIEALRSMLLAWVARCERNVKIARNLGIRWHWPTLEQVESRRAESERARAEQLARQNQALQAELAALRKR